MIFIIRHGQTAGNRANVLQGRSDIPLNEEGREQAKKVKELFDAEGIRFDRVYTSPLSRAIQTAEIIADKIPLTTDSRLTEMDYGPYEGMDLKNPAPEVMLSFRDFIHNPVPESWK